MTSEIATAKLLGIRKTGELVEITIRIGTPYPDSEGDWRCPVALDGLYKQLADQAGVDSLQALCLQWG